MQCTVCHLRQPKRGPGAYPGVGGHTALPSAGTGLPGTGSAQLNNTHSKAAGQAINTTQVHAAVFIQLAAGTKVGISNAL